MKREEEKEKIKFTLMEEEKAMDEEWINNTWREEADIYEYEAIVAEMHDLESEKI